jgi:hypothetical protein
MPRTLVALLFTLGLSACGGVVEEADEVQSPPGPASAASTEAEVSTHSAQQWWCELSDPQCSDVRGKLCHPFTTTYCCEEQRITCTCPKATGRWNCPAI